MSKEKLEEIKDKVSLLKNSSELQPHEFLVDILHLDWLIQQAEEKIQLEERVEELEKENKWLDGGWDVEIKMRENTVIEYDKLQSENQRYKQALRFYADEKNYEVTGEKTYIGHGDFTEETWIEIDKDRGFKARQAIKGDTNA